MTHEARQQAHNTQHTCTEPHAAHRGSRTPSPALLAGSLGALQLLAAAECVDLQHQQLQDQQQATTPKRASKASKTDAERAAKVKERNKR